MSIESSSFYNHQSFLSDVHSGEKIIKASEDALRKLPQEQSTIKVGDLIFSSGKGSRIENIQGKVIDKWYNGKFLAFKIDWDFASKKNSHSISIERLQDIKEI